MIRPNYWDINDRYCAQCHSPMTMKFIDDEWVMLCPKECEPGGHISGASVAIFKERDHLEYMQVARNYPELSGYEPPTKEELEEMSKTLYGE